METFTEIYSLFYLQQENFIKEMILRAKASAQSSYGVSILSYNILLPNSLEGGWMYKMYSPRHNIDPKSTTWESRKELLRRDIRDANCDIVCLQEVCFESWQTDFDFMIELGYDGKEIFRRSMFRPATFWKTSRVEIIQQPSHRDRCLVTQFRIPNADDNSLLSNSLFVANCHLYAASNRNQIERRFRQITDCLDYIRKESKKEYQDLVKRRFSRKRKDSLVPLPLQEWIQNTPLVLIGDMNCEPGPFSSVHQFLKNGMLSCDFEEDGVKVSNSECHHPFGTMVDAYEYCYANTIHDTNKSEPPAPATHLVEEATKTPATEISSLLDSEVKYTVKGDMAGVPPPPTMVCERLYGVLTTSHHTNADMQLSDVTLTILNAMYESFATETMAGGARNRMNGTDVIRWLRRIGGPNADSYFHTTDEYSKVAIVMNSRTSDNEASSLNMDIPAHGFLTFDEFSAVYKECIFGGKVWAVSYDFAACGFPLPLSEDVFTARYDRAYVGGSAVVAYVRDTVDAGIPDLPMRCVPHENHPSDHLPIMVVIDVVR